MKLQGVAANLSLFFAAISVAALLGEGMLRVLGINPAATDQVSLLNHHDSLLGWSKTPGASTVNQTSEYETTETINSLGLRGPDRPHHKPAGTMRVLMLGDSFLEGYTVNEPDLISTVVEGSLRATTSFGAVEVINGGTAGYATDQELLFLRSEGIKYQPDATVLLFYVNDVWFNTQSRYWRGSKPYFALGPQGALELQNVPTPEPAADDFAFEVIGGTGLAGLIQRTDSWFGRHFRLYFLLRSSVLQAGPVRRFMINRGVASVPGEWLPWSKAANRDLSDAWAVTEAILVEMQRESRAAGSTFTVYYVPSRPAVIDRDWERTRAQYGMTDAQWSPRHDATVLRAICNRTGMDCLIDVEGYRSESERLKPLNQKLYFDRDAHWTPAGHRFAGEQIANHLASRSPAERRRD